MLKHSLKWLNKVQLKRHIRKLQGHHGSTANIRAKEKLKVLSNSMNEYWQCTNRSCAKWTTVRQDRCWACSRSYRAETVEWAPTRKSRSNSASRRNTWDSWKNDEEASEIAKLKQQMLSLQEQNDMLVNRYEDTKNGGQAPMTPLKAKETCGDGVASSAASSPAPSTISLGSRTSRLTGSVASSGCSGLSSTRRIPPTPPPVGLSAERNKELAELKAQKEKFSQVLDTLVEVKASEDTIMKARSDLKEIEQKIEKFVPLDVKQKQIEQRISALEDNILFHRKNIQESTLLLQRDEREKDELKEELANVSQQISQRQRQEISQQLPEGSVVLPPRLAQVHTTLQKALEDIAAQQGNHQLQILIDQFQEAVGQSLQQGVPILGSAGNEISGGASSASHAASGNSSADTTLQHHAHPPPLPPPATAPPLQVHSLSTPRQGDVPMKIESEEEETVVGGKVKHKQPKYTKKAILRRLQQLKSKKQELLQMQAEQMSDQQLQVAMAATMGGQTAPPMTELQQQMYASIPVLAPIVQPQLGVHMQDVQQHTDSSSSVFQDAATMQKEL